MSLKRSYPGIILLALAVVIWAAAPGGASGAYIDAAVPGVVVELARPSLAISGAVGDVGTAFREEDAGFSASYRVPAPPATADAAQSAGGEAAPRLDIEAITEELTRPLDQRDPVDQSNAIRVHGRPGVLVERGVNFGIVAVPMRSVVGQAAAAPRSVAVYYDDRGWIVAYLPAGEPAAAIWRNRAAPGETYLSRIPNAHLEHNLLIAALNMVLQANDSDATTVTHAMAEYYHWEYPDCNAFLMFSHQSHGGDSSHRIRFVIPPAIGQIRASAGALITSPAIGGETTSAQVLVDDKDEPRAVATAPIYLAASRFDLARDAEATSVHYMWLQVDEGKSAAGVVMLLYHKPAS